MPLAHWLSDHLCTLQGSLFPQIEAWTGPLMRGHQRLLVALDMTGIDAFVARPHRAPGRPLEDRRALARAFVAKAVLGLATTAMLIERLAIDATLRRICGWHRLGDVPSEATFSRAFAEFAGSSLPERVHEALIERTLGEELVGHVTRDATAIEAREPPVKTERTPRHRPKRKPKRGEAGWEKLPRLARQREMTIDEMRADLPKPCDVGRKPNAKGNTNFWIGYKLHLDVTDSGIPVTALLTSASLNDSQAAIPLARMTAERITHFYELMDSAYDAVEIRAASTELGRVPLIAEQTRGDAEKKARRRAEACARRHANFQPAEARRLALRAENERIHARLKDEFGGRTVRVRGHAKVACHLMFGLLALTVDQLTRLVT